LLQFELIDDTKRSQRLRDLYGSIRPSYLKAKVAYVLGLQAEMVDDDVKLAEQFYFESLYILDLCPSGVRQ
jgi:hypothetical protein